jgi:phosphohistidine phosphatase
MSRRLPLRVLRPTLSVAILSHPPNVGTVKRLLIMRHAKSDWNAGARRDHERPLNRRGRNAAALMGRLLTQIDEVPDLVVTSSAMRARTTAEIAAEAGGWRAPVQVSEELYDTTPGEAVGQIGATPDEVERLMLVGHQPTWGGLVHRLTGATVQMKTATVAVIDLYLGTSWDVDEPVIGEIVTVLQPRHFADAAVGDDTGQSSGTTD